MKTIAFTILSILFSMTLHSQKPEDTEDWSRRPEIVTPGHNNAPPSDAIVLLGGNETLSNWQHQDGSAINWEINDGVLTVKAGTGDIRTKSGFADVQLHIEWQSPAVIRGEGQGRGNSGVFLMDKYEVQILDSYENETYYNGQAGSIYKQYIPLVNAGLKPGEWQTYDIVFTAPRFGEDKTLVSPAYMTVFHNGILIQNHVELMGPTIYIGSPEYEYHEKRLPIRLQDHGDAVSYRNIWLREL
ncbi:3-keto-disaccharide hydrolase [Alkaliflexus imshenetskii]|uniref:3-keto-disaccharide hydrolase n=1 Tax=Alkaliflexus imshenetskii TaxID=286730 RepID=UPI00047E0EC8|nr:DUF1080 domain-containing protein [Alkaliflexus imshenetskii]